MAAGVMSYDATTDVSCFVLDSAADLADCPTTTTWGKNDLKNVDPAKMGSQALDLSTGDLYMLKSDDTWVLI